MKKAVIFDFDGTICETALFSVPAIGEALKDMGYAGFSDAQIRALLGHTSEDTCRTFFGERAGELAGEFWQRVDDICLNRYSHLYRMFDGMGETLQQLHDGGYLVAVCSNADDDHIRSASRLLGIEQLLDAVQTAPPNTSKPENLAALLALLKADAAVMVGDRDRDVEAAAANALPSIGCLFGYGQPEEFAEATATVAGAGDIFDAVRNIIG